VAGAFVKPMGTGGGDDGDLFDGGSAVAVDLSAGGATTVGTGGAGGKNNDGVSATSHINQIGGFDGTAVFTQNGTDVTVVVKLTKCPDGVLGLHINSGDSCDNAGAEKLPWDGKRGNIGDSGTITCKSNSGSLTYTRSGADPTLSWSVGDHNIKTDVTNYVVIASTKADGTSNFIGCGNFFGG
jgi:hypothetical protein